jgi:hypothetical protein
MSDIDFLPRRAIVPLVLLLLTVLAWTLPPVAQHPHYHAFADQRTWLGIPHAADVLSNLPFALIGAAMLAALPGVRARPAERALLGLTALGLLLTAAASAAYHLHPADGGLVFDRAAMAVAFAGFLGLAACRFSEADAALLALAVLAGAPMALFAWRHDGNLMPWSVLQGAGTLGLLVFARADAPRALPVRWTAVVGLYALAKLLELGDHAVWIATHGTVAGHALKHAVAAFAALPVLAAMTATRARPHNAAAPEGALSMTTTTRGGQPS